MENTSGHEITGAGFTDIMLGAEAFKLLGISADTFKNPVEIYKLREIAEFLNKQPGAMELVQHIMRKAKTDKPLDHVLSYIKLQQNKQAIKKQLDELDKEIAIYE